METRFRTLTELRRVYRSMMREGVIEMTFQEACIFEMLVAPFREKDKMRFEGNQVKIIYEENKTTQELRSATGGTDTSTEEESSK